MVANADALAKSTLGKSSLGKSLGLGLGLRHNHADDILAGKAQVDWFEAISENYMDSGGRSLHILQQVAERYPVVFHGVSMSIGSSDPLDFNYLDKLKKLSQKVNPKWISDHLCWTGMMGVNSHDLLPLPLTDETFKHVTNRVNQVQDFLGRQLILENPSSYVQFKQSNISEPEFLATLCAETGCGLLLDVNNVFVTCFNAGFDTSDYLAQFPFEHVVQMHLAGHQDCGTHLIDTHDQPVRSEVWQLFKHCWQQTDGAATCLEWDGDIPDLARCEAEILKAKSYISDDQQLPDLVASIPKQGGVSTPVSFMMPDMMGHMQGDVAND